MNIVFKGFQADVNAMVIMPVTGVMAFFVYALEFDMFTFIHYGLCGSFNQNVICFVIIFKPGASWLHISKKEPASHSLYQL